MSVVRPVLALAAVAAMVTMSEAQFAQPGGGKAVAVTTTSPLAVTLLNSIDDPNLVAELKMTDDQVKALVARRQQVWDDLYTLAPSKASETAAARAEATDAVLKKTLSPVQYQRAVQLAAQNVLAGRDRGAKAPAFTLTLVSVTTLNRYPELVAAFKLTDDQKKQLTTPAPAPTGGGNKFDPSGQTRSVTMTAEQTAAGKEFLGPILARTWAAKIDPRQGNPPRPPRSLSLLAAKDVRADLKLTDDQTKEATALREKWSKLSADRRSDISPKEADAQAGQLAADFDKLLATGLKPEQAARLRQIDFQAANGGGHIDSLYKSAGVVQGLGLTDDQTKALAATWAAYRQEAAKVFETAASSDAAAKRLTELVTDRHAKAVAVLTPGQAARLAGWAGEPFNGSTLADESRGGGGPPGGDPAPAPQPPAGRSRGLSEEVVRAAYFGRYATEFSQLGGNKEVQDELKLTEEQRKKAAAVREDIATNHRVPTTATATADAYTKAVADRSKAIEAELGKLLTAPQAKRFREVMMQYRERPTVAQGFGVPSSARVNSGVAHPGVADEVKLTDDQKKKLFAGTAPADVLTADQKAAVAKLIGEPYKGGFNASALDRPGTPPGNPNPNTGTTLAALRAAMFGRYSTEFSQLAGNKTIQAELKMTDEQIKKATETRDEVAGKFPVPFATDAAAIETAYAARSKAVEEALGKVLTADQAKRFREIMLQSRERSGPGRTFLLPAVSYPGVAGAVKLTDEQKTKIVGGTAAAEVLNAEQKNAIAKMLGEPFKGDFTVPFSPRPPNTGGFPPFGAPPPAPAFARLAGLNTGLNDVLKLTPEQAKTFDAAVEAYQTAIRAAGPAAFGSSTATRNQALAAAAEAFTKATTGTLAAEQEKRLTQLVAQADAAANLFTALTAPDRAKELGLTDDQRATLAELSADAGRLQTLFARENLPDPERKTAARLRDAADDRMFAVLTAGQKAKWKELTGEAWAGLRKTLPNSDRRR